MQWKCLNLNDNHRDLLKTIKPTNKSVLIACDWVPISCLFFHLNGRKTSQEFIKLFFPRSFFRHSIYDIFIYFCTAHFSLSYALRYAASMIYSRQLPAYHSEIHLSQRMCEWKVITVQLSCEIFFPLASVNYRKCRQISKMLLVFMPNLTSSNILFFFVYLFVA